MGMVIVHSYYCVGTMSTRYVLMYIIDKAQCMCAALPVSV